MDASIYPKMAEFLNEKMGRPETAYARAGLPAAWTVVMPRNTMPQDIQTVLRSPALAPGVLVGIIQPGPTFKVQPVRGPYDPNQPRGGAIREAEFYLALFARSLKKFAHDGRLLMVEDVLQELLYEFSDTHPGVEFSSLESSELSFLDPDVHVIQLTGRLKYVTNSLSDIERRLRAIDLRFATIFDVLKRFEVPDEPVPNP